MCWQNLSVTPTNHDTGGLGTNLYRIQKSTGKLLANMHLQRGEVRRLGQYPVSGTGSMDIWEGLYLNEEKVAIKILRAVHSTPKSLQVFQHTNYRSTHLHKQFTSDLDAKSTFGTEYGKVIKDAIFSRSMGFARMMDHSRMYPPVVGSNLTLTCAVAMSSVRGTQTERLTSMSPVSRTSITLHWSDLTTELSSARFITLHRFEVSVQASMFYTP